MLGELCLSHEVGACLDPLTHSLPVPEATGAYKSSQAWLLLWFSPCPVASHQ